MNTRLLIAALFVLGIGVMATRADEDSGARTAGPTIGAEGVISASATVAAISLDSREVTLMGADGNTFVIAVGADVKNLAQIKVGDQVDVTYYEAVTVEVLDSAHTEPGVAATTAVDTAKPGEKPAAVAATEMAIVATVNGIDKAAETVTLTGPEGNTRTVKVRNPDNLDKVAVGDQILITFTRAVAIGVTVAPSGN